MLNGVRSDVSRRWVFCGSSGLDDIFDAGVDGVCRQILESHDVIALDGLVIRDPECGSICAEDLECELWPCGE